MDGEEKLDWTGCMGRFLIIAWTGKYFRQEPYRGGASTGGKLDGRV